MNYVDRNLRNGEEVIVKAKISFWYVLPRIIFCALMIAAAAVLTEVVFKEPEFGDSDWKTKAELFSYLRTAVWAAFPVVGAFPLLLRIIAIFTTHLAVTNKRVMGKQGILKIKTLDVPIEKIDGVSFNAGMLGNLFRYYHVKIASVGSQGYIFHAVSNAQKFKDEVNDAIEKHAEQARKDQAAQIAMAMNGSRAGD